MNIRDQGGGEGGRGHQRPAHLGHLKAVGDRGGAQFVHEDGDIQPFPHDDGGVEIKVQGDGGVAHVVAFEVVKGMAQNRLVPDLQCINGHGDEAARIGDFGCVAVAPINPPAQNKGNIPLRLLAMEIGCGDGIVI